MTELLPEDFPEIDDSDEQELFEKGCFRVFLIYIACYILVGVASTIAGVMTGSGILPFFGWTWPIWVLIILLGVGALN